MKNKIFLLIALFIFSCTKQDDCDSVKVPDCIQKQIDVVVGAPPFISVKMQNVDGECHYWLNTGAMNYDGVEYIVNSDCDTICYYCGECLPPECSDDHPFDKWETIWTK